MAGYWDQSMKEINYRLAKLEASMKKSKKSKSKPPMKQKAIKSTNHEQQSQPTSIDLNETRGIRHCMASIEEELGTLEAQLRSYFFKPKDEGKVATLPIEDGLSALVLEPIPPPNIEKNSILQDEGIESSIISSKGVISNSSLQELSEEFPNEMNEILNDTPPEIDRGKIVPSGSTEFQTSRQVQGSSMHNGIKTLSTHFTTHVCIKYRFSCRIFTSRE